MEEPHSLVTSVDLSTLSLCKESWGVVTTYFLISKTGWPSSDARAIAEKFEWDEPTRVVWTDWTQDDEGLALCDSGETELVVHADGGWADVEGVHGLVGDPVLLDLDELLAALEHLMSVERGDAKLNVRRVHSLEVLVSSEQDDLVVNCSVSLDALEALN